MGVTLYQSTDAGAPVLTGLSGALLPVLLGCLVTGYGAKPGAGWIRPFLGTNTAVFQNAQGVYYRVQDDVQVGAGAAAYVNGYATMTDADTGTNPFPLVVGQASIHKADAANHPGALPWIVLADSTTVYVWAKWTSWCGSGWGAFASALGTDGFAQFVGGTNHSGAAPNTMGPFRFFSNRVNNAVTDKAVLAIQRDYTGTGGAIQSDPFGHSQVSYYGNLAWTAGVNQSAGHAAYPSLGQIMLGELHLGETASPTVRGRLRGLWHWCHPVGAAADGDTFSGGSGGALTGLPGRTFQVVALNDGNALAVLETSNTWDLPT